MAIALSLPLMGLLCVMGKIKFPVCPLHEWTNIACPMCGSTRAWLALFHGNMGMAFRYNPLFWFWGFWLGAAYTQLWMDVFQLKSIKQVAYWIHWLWEKKIIRHAHIALILMNWVYLNSSFSLIR